MLLVVVVVEACCILENTPNRAPSSEQEAPGRGTVTQLVADPCPAAVQLHLHLQLWHPGERQDFHRRQGVLVLRRHRPGSDRDAGSAL